MSGGGVGSASGHAGVGFLRFLFLGLVLRCVLLPHLLPNKRNSQRNHTAEGHPRKRQTCPMSAPGQLGGVPAHPLRRGHIFEWQGGMSALGRLVDTGGLGRIDEAWESVVKETWKACARGRGSPWGSLAPRQHSVHGRHGGCAREGRAHGGHGGRAQHR